MLGGSSFTEVTVVAVRIIQAVKTDSPYVITGDAGAIIDLPAPAADWAVTQQYAVYEGGVIPAIPEVREVSSQPDPDSEGQATVFDTPDEEPEPPKRPYGNAPKSAWVAYAIAVRPELTQERAEGMSKADLMGEFGQRL
jgi:hypothetical protein